MKAQKKVNFNRKYLPGLAACGVELQDIYGKENFPTNCIELDILKYKPKSFFHQTKLLEKQSF